jgi:hypothetical protein
MVEIPLSAGVANAHQRFSIQLGTNLINFEIDFISYLDSPAWSMNLFRDGSPLVCGAMLEPGSDVIAPYRAGIGLLVFVGDPPTIDNLGIANHLVWVTS